MKLPIGPRTQVEHTSLPRGTWVCDACGQLIHAGEAITVSITPGEGRNRVEHEPLCAKSELSTTRNLSEVAHANPVKGPGRRRLRQK